MVTHQEKRPGHGLTLQQLLNALNEELLAQTVSGKLASDLDVLRSMQLEAKHSLSTIHSSMNTFSKINRLPPEVLASVPYFLDSYKDLVKSTHVCRHWRNTIIACPPLWSRLDNETMHQDLVATYTDRCGDTPLDVTFSSDLGPKNTAFLVNVVPRSSQIRTMRFPCLPWLHIGEFSNAFQAPLPLLREVDVDVGYSTDPPPFDLPFLAGATNLTSLSLHDNNRESGTLLHFVIPTLTHLMLRFDEPRVPIVGELLELLRNSPLIEDLHIRADTVQDSFDENSAFPDQFQPVELPCLREINLSWTKPRSQYTLLAHINYPPSCSVSMQLRSQADVTQPPQNVFPRSWAAFSLPDLSSVTLRMKREQHSTECIVIAQKPDGPTISISHLQDVSKFVYSNGEGDLVREPNRDRDDNHVLSDAVAFIRKLPPHWIRKFVLEDLKPDEMSKPESFEILPDLVKLICSELPNLTTLTLTRTCVPKLLNILTPPPPPPPMYIADLFDSDHASEPSLPCPSLKVLEMRHPDWIASRHCREVIKLTKARKDGGIPFKRIFFCSPVVPKSMIPGMSLYVDDIDIQNCEG